MVQSEWHVIYRLKAGEGQGGLSKHGRNLQRKTAMSGNSQQLTLRRSGVRSAMRVASQLLGKGPTNVNDAPAPAC